jgi:hypothetical protein
LLYVKSYHDNYTEPHRDTGKGAHYTSEETILKLIRPLCFLTAIGCLPFFEHQKALGCAFLLVFQPHRFFFFAKLHFSLRNLYLPEVYFTFLPCGRST